MYSNVAQHTLCQVGRVCRALEISIVPGTELISIVPPAPHSTEGDDLTPGPVIRDRAQNFREIIFQVARSPAAAQMESARLPSGTTGGRNAWSASSGAQPWRVKVLAPTSGGSPPRGPDTACPQGAGPSMVRRGTSQVVVPNIFVSGTLM